MTRAENSTGPWSKFIPDTVILILYIVLLDKLMAWQAQHLALSCSLLIVLNILAMSFGCFSFFCNYADSRVLSNYARRLNSFEGAVIAISTLLSAIGFLWWLVPFAAVKSMGVSYGGFFPGMLVYFIGFLAIVSKGIYYQQGIIIAKTTWFEVANGLASTLFFFFSYSFLLVTVRNWHSSFLAAPYLSILCLCLFYLPLRFFLLFRPPYHKLEYAFFIISFGYMLGRIFL